MDIVYFQGPKISERELRWSLRSVAANVPHERIFMLGTAPDWITDVTVIEANWPPHKWWSLHAKHRVLANPRLDIETMTAFDDDMYVLNPIDQVPPQYVKDFLARLTKTFRGSNKEWSGQTKSYAEAAYNSIKFLGEQGMPVEDVKNIAVHTPRVYEKDNLIDLAEKTEHLTAPIMWRTVYGNLYTEPELMETDVKIFNQQQLDIVLAQEGDYLSSHNAHINLVEEVLDGLFPEKCAYEA